MTGSSLTPLFGQIYRNRFLFWSVTGFSLTPLFDQHNRLLFRSDIDNYHW